MPRFLQKGQRVMTPLGRGTVEAFENFNGAGKSNPPVEIDQAGACRVVVRLDQPENWTGRTDDYPHPYMYRSVLTLLDE